MPRGSLSAVLVLVGVTLTGTGAALAQDPDPPQLPSYGLAPVAEPTVAPTSSASRRPPPEAPRTPRDRSPVGVTISSLSVEAVVVPVGVAADGSLMLPEPSTIGWWIGGAQPGDARGTTVLAGHVDAADGSQGALYDLSSVRGGDTIRIATAAGPLTYRVVALHNYRRQHLPKQLFDRRGPHRLAVITCGGSYDPRRGYSSNVVAYAVPAKA